MPDRLIRHAAFLSDTRIEVRTSMNNMLKIGLLLDSMITSAWAYEMVHQLVESDAGQVYLIILNDHGDVDSAHPVRGASATPSFLYGLFNKIDGRIFQTHPDPFADRDLSALLPDVTSLTVRPIQAHGGNCFDPMDIEKIAHFQPDILIKLGFDDLSGEILGIPRYGVWAYHHSDMCVYDGKPPGFWEAVDNWPETGSILQILGANGESAQTIYRSYSATYKYSPTRNRYSICWKSASFARRQIEQLYRLGEDRFAAQVQAEYGAIELYSHKECAAPSNFLTIKAATKLANRLLVRTWQKATLQEPDPWFLMYEHSSDEFPADLNRFKKMIPPQDRFWADPHILHRDDRYYIFLEEYLYHTQKGRISVFEMDEQGNYEAPEVILDKPYHLSYPFVFEYRGITYMIPESSDNQTIELYECMEFPHKWVFKMNLMEDIRAVDSTLVRRDGKWWLFANVAEHEGVSLDDELFLFYADDLETQAWQPHPLNPIISDVRRARPAGKIFERDGRLYRPSQDGSRIYGYGFNFNEIVTLNEDDYQEREVLRVRPDWDKSLIATHTFAHADQLTVIDVCMRRRKEFRPS